MNTIKKLLFGALIFSMPILNACNDDDDPVGCNYVTETQDELDAYNTALNAWTADPTNTQKCNAFKTAATNYLNALDDHRNCATTPAQEQELQDAIDASQASINQLQC